MARHLPDIPNLIPLRDVSGGAGRYVAESDCPWLRLEVDIAALAGRWVSLTYSSGLLDPLTRPLLRMLTSAGDVDEILPGALFGRSRWTGPIPSDAREIWISPTNGPGPFSFRIDGLVVLSLAGVVARIYRADVWRGGKFLWALTTGRRDFARLQARRVLGATAMQDYAAWRAERSRDYEPEFDGVAGVGGHHFRFLAERSGFEAVREALRGQAHANWSWREASDATALAGLRDDDLVVPLAENIKLAPLALAWLDAEAARRPSADLFFADEDFAGDDGRPRDPVLRPDEGAAFGARDLGALVAVRVAALRRMGLESSAPDISERLRAKTGSGLAFAHVRRVLATRLVMATPRSAAEAPTSPAVSAHRACVIIPTRDRVDLLSACVESLRAHDAGAPFEILVVDNDSAEPRTRAYLDKLAGEPDARVLPEPGRFNYSGLCNRAAKATDAPFLVFMNNDVEVLEDGWLARMLELAARPAVGAVGAKLLYPDGKVQHAGAVLGIDGVAGHFQRRLDRDSPGYFGPSGAPREVGAVTAACLAVEASKFAEVGGFDEVNLPIEANDIDLCLRLAARGWSCVLEPRAVLLHRESASRGVNPYLDPRYARQVGFFRQRWIGALRDDKCFHPALSLDSLDVALG